MPKGPRGEKRPADVIGAETTVARIATGEDEDTPPPDDGKDPAAVSMGKRDGAARAAGGGSAEGGGEAVKRENFLRATVMLFLSLYAIRRFTAAAANHSTGLSTAQPEVPSAGKL